MSRGHAIGTRSSRIGARFAEIQGQGRTALVPYITAGDPHPGQTVSLMHALVEGGADVIELGVPFSDPMADGPTIQRACQRALRHGTSLRQVLEMVAEFRNEDPDTPIVLMGYLNPIEAYGVDAFAKMARQVGVDGVLVVDMPVEEGRDVSGCMRSHGLDCVFLLAPTSNEGRVAAIVKLASGYLYYVSLKGVTGSDRIDVEDIVEKLEAIRRHSSLPVAVGFGIRNAETAARVAAVADAVVVGSVLVAEIERGLDDPERLPARLSATLRQMRDALDQLE